MQSPTQFIKAVPGDKIHQLVAIHYYNQGLSPAEAIDTLKASNYFVKVGGQVYKLQASNVASILTGILITKPAKNKKLHPVDNGASHDVPEIPAE